MVSRSRFSTFGEGHRPTGRPRSDDREPGERRHREPRQPSAEPAWTGLRRAWRAIGGRIPELRDDAASYVALHADRARLAASQVVTRAVVGVLALIAAAALLATAAALALVGIAGGIASALDGNLWLANVITGMGVILLLSGVIAFRVRMQGRQRLRRLQRRYDDGAAPRRPRAGAAGRAAARMSPEGEYLQQQVARTRARFRQTARTLADECLAPLEIRPFIRRRPWWSLGSVALGGFVSGLALGGGGRRRAGAGHGRGRVRAVLAAIAGPRARRVLRSVLSAAVVANLRRDPPAARAAATDADFVPPPKAT